MIEDYYKKNDSDKKNKYKGDINADDLVMGDLAMPDAVQVIDIDSPTVAHVAHKVTHKEVSEDSFYDDEYINGLDKDIEKTEKELIGMSEELEDVKRKIEISKRTKRQLELRKAKKQLAVELTAAKEELSALAEEIDSERETMKM